MNHRTTVAALLLTAGLTVTACSSSDDTDDKPGTVPSSTQTELTQKQKKAIEDTSRIPPIPMGEKRTKLLKALKAAAPDVVAYEAEAIDAARNQCTAISGRAKHLDFSASLRFTYKDVRTTEAQGAKINEALKKSGFCNV